MEAPERIYLFRNRIGVVLDSWYLNPCNQLENIEYTHTDAFIEKAVEWLKKNIEDYMYVLYDKDGRPTNNVKVAMLCFDDFKNYMKGE